MLRLRSFWLITIGPCLGEGASSRLRLTGEPKEWYARTLENEPLIWHKCGNWGRWTIFSGVATPFRGRENMEHPISALEPQSLLRSRNNSGQYD
jgi:hypothetical protein